jgi:hypothetical protein
MMGAMDLCRSRPLVVSLVLGLAILVSAPLSSALAAGASRPIPLVNSGAWCLAPNTSCTDGPWWQAQSERTSGRLRQATATYAGLDGLTSDPDFGEAVRLLWQWPEGRQALIGAADRGVQMVQGPRHPSGETDSFATYEEDTRTIEVAYEDMDVPTWMLADLLAHELRHANDLGSLDQSWDGSAGCFALEERAYSTEQRYMAWLAGRFSKLPSASAELDAGLSYAADDLYTNMLQIDGAANIHDLVHEAYAGTC